MPDTGYLEVPGGRLYYETEGSGHPLLLIHGGLGTLRMWDGQVSALADRYRVIRYDTRGFGQTEIDKVPFTNRADAAAVLAHLGASSACVVGQSRGGMIALDLAIDRPELVDALVSVAGGIGGYEPKLPDGVEPPLWEEMEKLWDAKDWEAVTEMETQVWVDGWGQPATRVDPALRKQVHDWILAGYQAGKEEGQPEPLDPPAATRLGEMKVPTLVMIGAADEPGGVIAERHLADQVSGARLVEFPNVAHMIQLERPERFNQVLLDFLAEVHPG